MTNKDDPTLRFAALALTSLQVQGADIPDALEALRGTTMTKPHEETWEFVAHYQHIDVPEGGDIGIFVDDRALDESEKARLRLAAQAPAMARMLLDLEWRTLTFDNDPWCVTCERRESQGHAPDCRLAAVLRAAGVLP